MKTPIIQTPAQKQAKTGAEFDRLIESFVDEGIDRLAAAGLSQSEAHQAASDILLRHAVAMEMTAVKMEGNEAKPKRMIARTKYLFELLNDAIKKPSKIIT